jgi:hypothetical protein
MYRRTAVAIYRFHKMVTIPHPHVVFGDLAERMQKSGREVSVPKDLILKLLGMYISLWDFDEDWYLATYPDVRTAVAQGEFVSGAEHFRLIGYLEGRRGGPHSVDTEWYIQTYPDIAQAMLEGKITSASEHFEEFGYAEGRLPSPPHLNTEWYVKKYMLRPDWRKVQEKDALLDFVEKGYRNLALPAPPRR